jgi:uncharacterized protein YndB with AHSA1/START domain/predicted enzyme related to lactoylglutathione lyase
MATATSSTVTLSINRFIKAQPQRVFSSFIKSDELMKWFGPDNCRALSAQLDPRVGGKYKIRVRDDEMGEIDVFGVYREVQSPRRLVFTWNFKGNPELEFPETLVTVEFIPTEEGTDVQLMHEDLPNPAMRDTHSDGWNATLIKLGKFLAPEECSGPGPSVGTFCWNELMAGNLGEATSFYSRLFDWEIAESPVKVVPYKLFKQQMNMVGGALSVPTEQGTPPPSPQWLAYVRVLDVDGSAKKAVSLGGKLCHGPTDIEKVGRIAVVQDPQGAVFGLFAPSKMG